MTPRILAFAGSLRRNSWNHRLVEAAGHMAQHHGADVSVIRLSDHPIPLYDQDVEEASGLPDEVVALKAQFRQSDGLLIASPEYNGAYSAALKNVIDWVSRPEEGRGRLDCFAGKTAGLLAGSPGKLGGIRGLPHLATLLSGIGVTVLPGHVCVSNIHEAFDDDGTLMAPHQAAAETLAHQLVDHCRAILAPSDG